jgi:hypothetical protein
VRATSALPIRSLRIHRTASLTTETGSGNALVKRKTWLWGGSQRAVHAAQPAPRDGLTRKSANAALSTTKIDEKLRQPLIIYRVFCSSIPQLHEASTSQTRLAKPSTWHMI